MPRVGFAQALVLFLLPPILLLANPGCRDRNLLEQARDRAAPKARPTPPDLRAPVAAPDVGGVDDGMQGLVGTAIGESVGHAAVDYTGSRLGGGGTGALPVRLPATRRPAYVAANGRPEVVLGTVRVRGAIDPEVVRRIVRRHLDEVLRCYEAGLAREPALDGRVAAAITIASTGEVTATRLQQSTMPSQPVEECIDFAIKRWEFPRPRDGLAVEASCAFVLKRADTR